MSLGPGWAGAARILCIEDDHDLRQDLCEALEQQGYLVQGAGDGPTGLAMLREGKHDLVLLDLGLPGMDGMAVCQEIKRTSDPEFLPVVFITGNADVRTKIAALREGADDFCMKPLDVSELDARISRLLEARQRERHLRAETGRFRSLAFLDALTGLGNRRALEKELARAWRAVRDGTALALLAIDIDHFKAFNDRFGHRTGDEALVVTGATLARGLGPDQEAFRSGGEEFTILAPGMTLEPAFALAERLRRALEDAIVMPPLGSSSSGPLHLTASIGIAATPHPSIPSHHALVEVADRALYQAKALGRNQVHALFPNPLLPRSGP